MSKVIAFLLGMIFGLMVVLGAVAACIFVVTPDMVTGGNASDVAGDFGSMSLYGMYDKITKMYKQSVGNFYKYKTDDDGNFVLDEKGRKQIEQCDETEGQLLTLGMFCATTGIDLDKLVNTELPASVYDVPMIEYFNGNDGINNALKQIKVSTLPDIVNIFATVGENGEKFVSQSLIDKINDFSVFDLLQDNGIKTVFNDVLLIDVLPKAFPEDSSEGKEVMFALGQTSVGGLLGAFGEGGNVFAELKPDGALAELGNLQLTTFFEANSVLANALSGIQVSSLISDDGKITIDSLTEQVKVGALLGYTYDESNDNWYTVDGDGNKVYAEGAIASIVGLTLKQATNFDTFLNIKLAAILSYQGKEVDVNDYPTKVGTFEDVRTNSDNTLFAVKYEDVWYEASLRCTDETHTDLNSHTRNCFVVNWYQNCTTPDDHEHTGDKHLVLVEGLFANIADITVGQLVNDGVNGLLDALKSTKLGELGFQLPDMLKNFADMTVGQLMKDGAFDNIYVGEILGYKQNILDETVLTQYALSTEDGNVRYYTDVNGTTYYAKKVDEDDWAEASLTCTDETTEHKHNADCFSFVWYKDCTDNTHDEQGHKDNGEVLIDGKYCAKVDGLYNLFADFTIAQLTSGNDITGKLMDIKLNQLIDESTLNANPLLKNFADKTIRQLTNQDTINGLYLGQVFEGFTRQEVTDEQLNQYTTTVYADGEIALVLSNAAGELVRKNGVNDNVWYKAKFVCTDPDDTAHIHDVKCYPFVWSKDGVEQTEGMQVKLASYTIAELNDINGTVNQMTLRDVLGDNIPKQFTAIADEKIGNLQNAIQTLMLGNVMNYTDKVVESNNFVAYGGTTNLFTYIDASGKQLIAKKVGDKYYATTTQCNHTSAAEHTADCYYIAWTDEDGVAVSGLMGKLAEKQISQLGDIQSSINEMTLGDVMQDNIPDALASLKDTRIDKLGEAIDNMYVGEMLQSYYKKSTADLTDVAGTQILSDNGTVLLYVKQSGASVYVSKNGSEWFEGVSYCNDNTHTHNYKCFGYKWYSDITCTAEASGAMARIANLPISQLGNANEIIDELTLADVMGQDNVPDMLKSLKDTKIGNLGEAINNLYVADALNASRKEVTDISSYTTTVVSGLVVKNAGGQYAIKIGEKWYDAEQTCGDDEHTHTADCFRAIWTKSDGEKLDGVVAAIADMKLSELSNNSQLNDRIQNLKLRDVMTIDPDDKLMNALADCKISQLGNKVQTLNLGDVVDCTDKPLNALANTPINEIGTKFNQLKLGEVVDTSSSKVLEALANTPVNQLGTAANDLKLGDVIDVNTDSNPILKQMQNTKVSELGTALDGMKMGVAMGYTEVTTCSVEGHTATTHWHDTDGNEIKGVYKKIADKTLNDMSGGGMNGIMTGLTMGDLYDSGILNLQSGDEYSLAILVGCSDSFTETVGLTGNTFTCNLTGYMTYKALHSTVTAKEFFEKAHDGKTAEETTTCLNKWKAIPMTEFITNILSALR